MDLAELQKQIGIDLTKDAEDLEVLKGTFDFKMFTRDAGGNPTALKAYIEKDEDGEDQMVIAGVASSTIKDRHGDTMLPSALIDMERQANDNLTIFLNHEYKVPRDVAGSVAKASIQSSATDPETGAPIYDLAFEKIRINKENPLAVETFKALQPKGKTPGTKLGLSIGARIPEGGAIRNKKTGTLLIAHVDLLETSIVSIPANPRSWIQNAVKALKAGPVEPVTGVVLETLTLDPPPSADDIATAVDAKLAARAAQVNPPTNPPVNPPTNPPVVPASTASTAPSQGAPTSEPGADGATTPDVAAAAAPVPPVDPEELAKLATPDLIQTLVQAQAALAKTSSLLIDTQGKLTAAEQRAATAEQEAAEIAKTARDVVLDAAQIVRRLEKLPVGQRASFKQIKSDFEDGLPAGLDGIYTESFIRQLRGDPTT